MALISQVEEAILPHRRISIFPMFTAIHAISAINRPQEQEVILPVGRKTLHPKSLDLEESIQEYPLSADM